MIVISIQTGRCVGKWRPDGRMADPPGDSITQVAKVTWADVVRGKRVSAVTTNVSRKANEGKIVSSSFSRNNPVSKTKFD